MLENMLLLNWWVATGVLILELALLGKLFSLIVLSLPEENNFRKNFKEIIFGSKQKIFQKVNLNILSEKFLLFFIFIFSFAASIMTLVYSEYFGVIPCALCWFERIFMYGIVIISATALFSNRELEQKGILKYILNFSILGALVSLYHHVLQITATMTSHLPCPASGGDCAKRLIFEYGHVTFPWMALILFTFFIVIILLQKKLDK